MRIILAIRADAHYETRTIVIIRKLACIGTTVLLAACSGAGSSSSPGSVSPTLQLVSGTLSIGSAPVTAQSRGRKPAFVSPGTGHAALFIDGVAAASGSTTTCVAATGTGTGCTIAWSAQLSVPAPHVFAVEADTGDNAPANTVLSEGAGSYAVVAGSGNALDVLPLNGVVNQATFAVTNCSGVTPISLCNGTVMLAAAAGNAIEYTGATVVPTIGNGPSSGNVFDNGAVTFVSNNAVAGTGGLVTGTAQTASANVFSTLATNILTVSGVNTTGIYAYQVTCNAAATGSFGLTIAGAATPSLAVSTAELAALSPAVTYPAGGITVVGTAPLFTCAGGTISGSTGTLPVN
jgi:hypothetical protein